MKRTSQMKLKECRRELEQIGQSRDRRVWESDDEYVTRMASNKARELVLRNKMKSLREIG